MPGACSVSAHLSISGLPTDNFFYVGFLPKQKGKRESIFRSFNDINGILKTTFVVLESKYKIITTLKQLNSIYPECKVSVGKDLTKMHESVFYGKIGDVLGELEKRTIKGEFIVHILL